MAKKKYDGVGDDDDFDKAVNVQQLTRRLFLPLKYSVQRALLSGVTC
jgi:hypothetical protein